MLGKRKDNQFECDDFKIEHCMDAFRSAQNYKNAILYAFILWVVAIFSYNPFNGQTFIEKLLNNLLLALGSGFLAGAFVILFIVLDLAVDKFMKMQEKTRKILFAASIVVLAAVAALG